MLKKLSKWFNGGSKAEPSKLSSETRTEKAAETRQEKAARIAEDIRNREAKEAPSPQQTPPASMMPPREEMTPPQEEPRQPVRRTIIQAPIVAQKKEETPDDGTIRIKAEPSKEGDSCKFMVNRSLFPGHSWYFPSFESAGGSPLAERMFSLDEVENLLIHESTATVTRKTKGHADWKPMATEIGKVIREILEAGQGVVDKKIEEDMPPAESIREEIQKVIDEEVNPGVAGHGGRITLRQVEGNTVTIEMGGGCQGCSAADLTLKQGIHNAFRKSVPFVGAIYDETDHAAGQNPYFS